VLLIQRGLLRLRGGGGGGRQLVSLVAGNMYITTVVARNKNETLQNITHINTGIHTDTPTMSYPECDHTQ
jgi:hypothetical protein